MKRMLFTLFVSLLLLFSVVTMTASAEQKSKSPSERPMITSKVATYNMAAGIGIDGKYNLDRIANTIRDTGADIIGLQEVDVHWGSRSQYDHTIEKLAEALDMHYFFAPIYDLDPEVEGDQRREYGVGILSKYPIINAYNREIRRLSTQDSHPEPVFMPGFLEAQLNIEGEEVWVYVTHLDYRADPAVREMQVDDMLRMMSEHPYSILVGDLNATPDAPELTPLFQSFNDAWQGAADGAGYTFPADHPTKRIDYVLISPRMDVMSTHVTESLASDHLPVTAEISFLGEHSDTVNIMRKIVESFAEMDQFTSEEAIRHLSIHLTALEHYEKQENKLKMLKHLVNFKTLLDYQNENEMISERAYNELFSDAEHLIDKWSDIK